jgi:Flagellar capping protein
MLSISAISQYSTLYSLAGLSQTNPLSSVYSLDSQRGMGASTTSLYSVGRQEDSYKVKLSGYGQLKSSFDTFQKALDTLNSSQEVSPFKATSSKESVLTAATSKDVKAAGTYSVNVTQLATAQTLKSGTVADADSTIVGSGSLKIQVGAYNSNLNTFTAGESAEVTVNISTGNGTLGSIANAINNADAGVKASVVAATGGGYQLQLTATDSGTENTVKVAAFDTSGTQQTGTTGLGQLAFDPTAAVGSGKNLTETTVAQNALLTVDGKEVVSQSNTVSDAINGVSLSLAATGATAVTVNVNRDVAAFEASAKKFVESFNALQKTVNTLSRRSPENANPPLASDAVSARLTSQVREAITTATTGFGTSRVTLSDLGITRKADNTLALDTTKLQSAFNANPEGATTLLANTAQKVSDIITRGTGATSELKFATQNIERSIQGLQTQRAVLQDYSTVSAFGMSASSDYSLFTYMFSSGTASSIARYTGVYQL